MGRKKINHFFVSNNGSPKERVLSTLHLLGLEGMASSLDNVAEKAIKKQSTFFDFIEDLVSNETIYKESKRIERWIRLAKFSSSKQLEEFDFSFQPSIDKKVIRELASCRFVDDGKNVLFLGPPGVGKTHLSIALGMEAINKGHEARFFTLDKLIELGEKALHNAASSSYNRLFAALTNPKLLILDDIDFYETSKDLGMFLFQIIKERYDKKRSTILTSNKKFDEWKDLFGESRRAEAALDRILERVVIINITGDSYRIKDRLAKLKNVVASGSI